MTFKNKLKFYVITDRKYSCEVYSVEQALKGGATAVQLRMKSSNTREMVEVGQKIRKLTLEYDALFFVNDRLDIAQAVKSDGIHVGIDDISISKIKEIAPELIIGASAYNINEMKIAESEGADYLGVGSVYPTNTKLDARYLGLNGLKELSNCSNLPVVAIGGINHENVKEVLMCGVSGVAVVSAIVGANDIIFSAKKMNEIIKKYI
ncbi:thiamine-phosphate pyrophosphorylase [Methanococcus vannielii SB]|uniref:Thiamine-phosphate synthase n=1 Tax=Methanococcus vannielii (strain ATCC 35089 / DSM 1224 / JCM 13029 / OCM 148 / SB) TaxID=406327 RepID=THIE_METVS|nr:thiamine phosphate synthase [Methanococcus vannielii]A6UPE6.1 RecName: Full=Thiamine-phosphate synthase; Short=TP synthase; Short=TPS; AltName: Full=Thiamine-phosphate pyrophosphorylase; Short=TMP pyrophosphorylase; Short=TMP-PPase [Methanococcus vannielii SB]ABR54368.1 thiamine-phosphate pyrophosphorylase [Methanococcus vannielii SB]